MPSRGDPVRPRGCRYPYLAKRAIRGDSNAMYNMSKRVAHLPAQVGRHIGMPLTFWCPWWGHATPAKLAEADARGKLKGRRVIVWTNIGRVLAGDKWAPVRLPPSTNKGSDEPPKE